MVLLCVPNYLSLFMVSNILLIFFLTNSAIRFLSVFWSDCLLVGLNYCSRNNGLFTQGFLTAGADTSHSRQIPCHRVSSQTQTVDDPKEKNVHDRYSVASGSVNSFLYPCHGLHWQHGGKSFKLISIIISQ